MSWKSISATAIAAVALLAVFGPAAAQTTTTTTPVETQPTVPPTTQGSGTVDVNPNPSSGQASGTTDPSASPGGPGTADEESAKARGVERR